MIKEQLISNMMNLSVKGRLWHWMTDRSFHHQTFEQFLTQNEALTDSFVESSLGNEIEIDFSKVGVTSALGTSYSIGAARTEIINYRSSLMESKNVLETTKEKGSDELISILEDIIELSSKTLYMLKLS